MIYIRKIKDGKSQIIKDEAFCTLLNNQLPEPHQPLTEVLLFLAKTIKEFDPTVTKDALSNAAGDWYEWLLAVSAWNFCAENPAANLALLTPNKSQFDIASLYNEKLYNLIKDLKSKVLLSSSVQLISSNPDFVIIDRKLVDTFISKIEPIEIINPIAISKIEQAYKVFTGNCNFEDIIGYISVKSSLRPDRRLQIPHEGSLMKAIYTHLQTREWIMEPKGLKYYAMSTQIKPADERALRTVATHSITTVHSLPQAAVDGVFEVNSLEQARLAFEQIQGSV